MIHTLEQVFPSEVAIKVFKFCNRQKVHPCAVMVKNIFDESFLHFSKVYSYKERYVDTGYTTIEQLKNKWDYESCLTYIRDTNENKRIIKRIQKECEEEDRRTYQRHYQQYSHVYRYI